MTEKIRRRPYSVVLLDEIEKAHPDVWNSLLQIMEEGRLTDSFGRTIDFKNTIIIMTTNIGAETIVASDDMTSAMFGRYKSRQDAEATYTEMKNRLKGQMDKVFRPEFLNRVDDIIVFRSLTKIDLKTIVGMELGKVVKRLKEKGLALIVTTKPRNFSSKRARASNTAPGRSAEPSRTCSKIRWPKTCCAALTPAWNRSPSPSPRPTARRKS